MNIKSLSACLLMLGAAGPPDPSDPRLRPVTSDPNDPEKTRATVFFPEKREKLGLTPKTWSGVVHPDVYPTLDRLNKTVESLGQSGDTIRMALPFPSLVRRSGYVFLSSSRSCRRGSCISG